MEKFLVVYEDLYNVKESFKTNKIGDTIKDILYNYSLKCDYNYEKLNSDNPYAMLGFSKGFYDLDCKDNEGEYAGRIMIFSLEDL